MLEINGITPSALWETLAVLVLICGVVSIVLGAVEKVQNLRQKKAQAGQTVQADVMVMLGNDKRRLDAHEAALGELQRKCDKLDGRTQTLEEGQKVMCKGVMALLDHELHNGNAGQMEDASKSINSYLLDK